MKKGLKENEKEGGILWSKLGFQQCPHRSVRVLSSKASPQVWKQGAGQLDKGYNTLFLGKTLLK